VQNNLHESQSLDELAQVACFSSFHFHRIFTAITGETVNFFTNRLRLEKAARLLKYSNNSATEIALDCGFSSSSTFSRSFKQYFGTSPNEYKKTGIIENSKIRKELFSINKHISPMSYEQLSSEFPIEIKEFPQRRVAFIRVIGAYGEGKLLEAFGRMVDWAKEMNLCETETVFGMSIDDPMVTPQDKYRYEVCLTIPDSIDINNHPEISVMTMPKINYAVTRVSGDFSRVATATNYLFSDWLINSPYEPEHQHGLEIFLDKENVCNWNHFDLDLCIPVKKLQRI
jgi:AraC family transcriptional regulator